MGKKILKAAIVLAFVAMVACIAVPNLLMIPLMLFGGYESLRMDAPLLEAHQRAVNSFVDSRGFGASRMRHKSHWNDYLVELDGELFDPERIQLIGLTEEYGDRYFDDPYPPRKEVLDDEIWRETTPDEDEAIAELRDGAGLSKRIPGLPEDATGDGSFRVLAPIIAGSDCLKCHEVGEGEIIGAFSYTLVPRIIVDESVPEGQPPVDLPSPKADPSSIPRPARGL